MATEQNIYAFNAFESQLRTLCLHEFPCGIGLWSENHGKTRKHIHKNRVNSRFVVTLKDFGADYEKTETLEELVVSKTSPWNADYSWSNEAKQLREIAVRSPWLIDETFVLSHFKSLRIVDKEVTEVDELLTEFTNLRELSLSANKLRTVNSRNLPRSLEVLELCANRISNLADLCMRTPPLIHLGLGYNSITMVDDYITGDYWPKLLSLDLGHNNLSDMMDIVRKLGTLPKLRNLILLGNPLALLPSYRGYTIDSLRSLSFLDDISISADERHHFKGLAKKKEYILDEVKVTLKVNFMKNIPMPDELKNPEDQPEYPVVTKKYFVRFQFPEDKSTNAEIFQIIHDDDFTQSASGSQVMETGSESMPTVTDALLMVDPTADEKNVSFAEEAHGVAITVDTQRSDVPSEKVGTEGSLEDVDDARSLQMQMETKCGAEANLVLAPIDSTPTLWSEDMEVMWYKTVNRDELLGFRNFLKQGMEVFLMEEKVCSFPADQVHPEGTASPDGSKKGSEKKKDDKKKDEKQKDPKSAVKGGKDDKAGSDKDKKKGGKKGEPDVELADMPAEYTTLAKFRIPLEDFLDGEFVFENVFVKYHEDSEGVTPSEVGHAKKAADSKKDKLKQPASAIKKDKGGNKSPKPDKAKDAKGKGKGAEETEAEEANGPPPPIEVHVGVKLHHWLTARDCMKTESEENSQSEEQSK